MAEPGGLSLGARIVTSGDDGVFPPDLTVGVVGAADGRVVRVGLAADYQRLDFVRILRWQREAPQALPPALIDPDPLQPAAPAPLVAPPPESAPAVTGALIASEPVTGPTSPRPAARPAE